MTEDLIIEHKPVETASFDVDRRVLTLPVWDRASETVYDMLVAHEVGHAHLSSKDTEVSTEISKMDTMNYIMMTCLNYQVRM